MSNKVINSNIANNLAKCAAELLDAELKHVYTKDSYGKETNKIVIEYKVETEE